MTTSAIEKACAIAGGTQALADMIGVKFQTVHQWKIVGSGGRPVPVERCVAIERATDGRVTRKDLRPDDWHLIWPELSEKAA